MHFKVGRDLDCSATDRTERHTANSLWTLVFRRSGAMYGDWCVGLDIPHKREHAGLPRSIEWAVRMISERLVEKREGVEPGTDATSIAEIGFGRTTAEGRSYVPQRQGLARALLLF